jgi:hypothetical protein
MRTSGNGVRSRARHTSNQQGGEAAAHGIASRAYSEGGLLMDRDARAHVSRGIQGRLYALATTFWGQAALCMVVAGLIRVIFLLGAHGMIDGDEAAVGYQAEQVLHGVWPAYIMNDNYVGALAVYLNIPLLLLLGPNAWTLRIPSLLKSLALIPLTGALAERLYGRRARLPALVLSALPALYVAVGELRALGGYIETMVFGTATLLLVVVVVERLGRGQRILRLVVGLGVLSGLAFWTFPLFIEYAATAGLWALPLGVGWLRRAAATRTLPWRRLGLGVLGGLGGVLVGYSPAVIYGLGHHLVNFQWLLALVHGSDPAYRPEAGQTADPLRPGQLVYLLTRALPRLTGSYPLWSPAPSPSTLQHVGLAFFAAAMLYTSAQLAQRVPVRGRGAAVPASFAETWKLVLAPLLLVLVSLMYWRSSFSDGYVYNFDRTGRYMLPAGIAVILLLAYLFAGLPALCGQLIGWAQARMHRSPRTGTAGQDSSTAVGVAVVLFGVLLAFNLTQYIAADAVRAMQTPYRQRDVYPAVDGQLLTYLEQHHITTVWATHWLAYVLMYQSNSRIVAADTYQDRFPQNVQTLLRADRPSYIIEADPAKGECAVAKALDALHVTYTAVPFQHWWLITPISRTVAPAEIASAIAVDEGT